MKVLILGGTTEARLLAAACATMPDVHPVTSLAGRTDRPLPIAGELRIGGFGGAEGLADHLRAERIDAVVDATHTFAATMTRHAALACAATDVPLLVLRRPGWTAVDGDRWFRVPTLDAAAAALPALGGRIFLTTGRQGIGSYAGLDDRWFLARSVEPPQPPMPARLDVVLDRGPFTLDGELALMTDHRIDVLVTKDSGGPDAKLRAARQLGLPVVMVDRPPIPAAARRLVVFTVDEALTWLRTTSTP